MLLFSRSSNMSANAVERCEECTRRVEEQRRLKENRAIYERATASFYHLFDVMSRRSREVLMEKYNEVVPEEKKICVESFIFGADHDGAHVDPVFMREVTDLLGVRFSIYSYASCYSFDRLAANYELPEEPMGFKELRKNFDRIGWNLSVPQRKHVFKVMKKFLKHELKSLEETAFRKRA